MSGVDGRHSEAGRLSGGLVQARPVAAVMPERGGGDTPPGHGPVDSAPHFQSALRFASTQANRGTDQKDPPRPTAPREERHTVPASAERSLGKAALGDRLPQRQADASLVAFQRRQAQSPEDGRLRRGRLGHPADSAAIAETHLYDLERLESSQRLRDAQRQAGAFEAQTEDRSDQQSQQVEEDQTLDAFVVLDVERPNFQWSLDCRYGLLDRVR